MKDEILNIFKENLIIKISLFFILLFPVILLVGSSVINTSIIIMNILFLTHIINEKNFQIFKSDCFEFFNSYQKINEKFDIIFLDPPFKEKKINKLIEKIIENKILNAGGIIIIHRHKKDKMEITDKIKIFDIRNYGLSRVYFAN